MRGPAFILPVACAALLSIAPVAVAAEFGFNDGFAVEAGGIEDYELYEPPEVNTAIHKLGRGVTGIVTAWVTLPKSVHRETREAQGIAKFGAPFVGAAQGSVAAVKRIGLGAWELATFPVPVPRYYKSVYEHFGMQESAYE